MTNQFQMATGIPEAECCHRRRFPVDYRNHEKTYIPATSGNKDSIPHLEADSQTDTTANRARSGHGDQYTLADVHAVEPSPGADLPAAHEDGVPERRMRRGGGVRVRVGAHARSADPAPQHVLERQPLRSCTGRGGESRRSSRSSSRPARSATSSATTRTRSSGRSGRGCWYTCSCATSATSRNGGTASRGSRAWCGRARGCGATSWSCSNPSVRMGQHVVESAWWRSPNPCICRLSCRSTPGQWDSTGRKARLFGAFRHRDEKRGCGQDIGTFKNTGCNTSFQTL